MPTSTFMKWLLGLNVVIWCFASILLDLGHDKTTAGWIVFGLVTLCKAWIASQICIIIAKQPTP